MLLSVDVKEISTNPLTSPLEESSFYNMHGNRYIPMSFFDSISDARTQLREKSLISLELQAELAEFLKSPRSVVAYQHFINVYGGRKLFGDEKAERGVWLHQQISNLVGTAPTYYVTQDMSEMIKMAAEEMPSEGLSPTIIPSEKGFLVFANPLPINGPPGNENVDVVPGASEDGQIVKVAALAWEQGMVRSADGPDLVPGIQYYLFSTAHDLAVVNNRIEAAKLAAELGVPIVEPLTVEGAQDVFVTEVDVKQGNGPLPIYDFSGWSYGRPWNEVPYTDPAGVRNSLEGAPGELIGEVIDGVQQVHPVVDQARRYLLATWLMLSQTVTTLQTEAPPRYLRRRASRFMPETGDIVIIRLRKEVTEGDSKNVYHPDDEDVPWYNHRFLVRGHWKRQRFGPGGADRKLIWVSPFIKGPADAPLVLKDKIYALEQ